MNNSIQKKILIFIPAYNVEKQILRVLKRMPIQLLNEHFIRILIIEDCSKDNTKKIIEDYIKANANNNLIRLIKNEKNYGYGDVQKIAFNYALKNDFDYVIMLHGDDQYDPERIPIFISNLLNGRADAVFGSRFINPKEPLKNGMPFNRYIGNRIVTFIQNMIVGTKMTEFHSGYRSYKIDVLKKINFEKNTNDFYFDSEIIIQMSKLNFIIKEIQIKTIYADEISNLKPIPYGINVLLSTIKYKFFYKD
jgi:glycosyltransferase involved in cell wall biosynthesis